AGAFGGGAELASGLVDEDEVGTLRDAAFHALKLVAARRREQEDEDIGHVGNHGLRLADADRLDEDDIGAPGLDDEDRLARAPSDAAEGLLRGRGADEDVRMPRKLAHPRLVAEDRAARAA